MLDLTHILTVDVPLGRAWAGLHDALGTDPLDGELSLRVGPVSSRFEGAVQVVDRDLAARRFRIAVDARDLDGPGTVAVTATVSLDEVGPDATDVHVRTEGGVTGRLALAGDAVVEDIVRRLLHDVAARVADAGWPEAAVLPEPRRQAMRVEDLPASPEVPSIASKAAPYAVVLLLLWILRRMFGAVRRVTSSDADRAAVEALLGRRVMGAFEVVVRHADGSPVVLRNAPLMFDGTPMPTRFWLVGEPERTVVSRLEAAGGVRRAEAEVDPVELAAAHARYAAERDSVLPPDHEGPRPSGGVGGTRLGVKCLHAHYGWYLAGGDDPVGRWVAEQLDDG